MTPIDFFLQKAPANARAQITGYYRGMLQYYQMQIKKKGASEAFLSFRSIFDKEIQSSINSSKINPPSCTKGCSFCCYVNVDITDEEAKVLIPHVTPDVKAKLEKQRHITQKTYATLPYKDRACAFLVNGTCSVYNDRPLACRKYMVTGDKELCNTENTINKVPVISMLVPEILYGVHNTNNSFQSMAPAILKFIA